MYTVYIDGEPFLYDVSFEEATSYAQYLRRNGVEDVTVMRS